MTLLRRIKLTAYCVFLFGAVFFIISLLITSPLFHSEVRLLVVAKDASNVSTADSIEKAGYALNILESYLPGDTFYASLSSFMGDSFNEILSRNDISEENWAKHITPRVDKEMGTIAITIKAGSSGDATNIARGVSEYLNKNLSTIVNNSSLEAKLFNGPAPKGQIVGAEAKYPASIGALTGLLFAIILQLLRKERADWFLYAPRDRRLADAKDSINPAQTALGIPIAKQSPAIVEERALRERLNRLINGDL